MKPEERQKLCVSCEGRIPLVATICPYCTAEQSGFFPKQPFTDKLNTSLYPPLYSVRSALSAQQESTEEVQRESNWAKTDVLGAPTVGEKEEVQQENDGTVFWPTLLLSLGAQLLLLGVLQLCFSDEGFLTLQWNSRFWYLYCLAAVPLLWLGLKIYRK
jgi:hypothetical protein